MLTSIGAHAAMTEAVVRAGINSFQETGFVDHNYEPVRMAPVPDAALTVNLEGQQSVATMSARQVRLLRLASTAIVELVPYLPAEQKIPLFIAGPEQIAGVNSAIGVEFINHLAVFSTVNLDIDNSRGINIGRAGGIDAIATALKYLESSQQEYAIVAGVDSYYDLAVINHYIENDRILTRTNKDGFIPGEAVGFLLLRAADKVAASEPEPGIGLFEPGIAYEPGHILNDAVYKGDGLASAFSQALQGAAPDQITAIYSSMNGERYWAKELGVASLRNRQFIHADYQIHHPADCLGDIGAAMGVVLVGIASLALQAKKKNDACLVYSSSDSEYRGAVRLSRMLNATRQRA